MTPKEKLERKYHDVNYRTRKSYIKALKKIQAECVHPEEYRREDGGSYWYDWPDYGFNPGEIKCDLCGKVLGKSYKNYKGYE